MNSSTILLLSTADLFNRMFPIEKLAHLGWKGDCEKFVVCFLTGGSVFLCLWDGARSAL